MTPISSHALSYFAYLTLIHLTISHSMDPPATMNRGEPMVLYTASLLETECSLMAQATYLPVPEPVALRISRVWLDSLSDHCAFNEPVRWSASSKVLRLRRPPRSSKPECRPSKHACGLQHSTGAH